MERKVLGKIESVSFGFIPEREFLFGLSLTFRFESGGVQGNDTINIGKECKWTITERQRAIAEMIDRVAEVMRAAKVLDVADLKGKPVEVTLEDDWYKEFRILTEVL